jgi:hypothetical protein
LNLAEAYTAQGRFHDAEALLLEQSKDIPMQATPFAACRLFTTRKISWTERKRRPFRPKSVLTGLGSAPGFGCHCWKATACRARQQLESYVAEAPNGPQSEQVRRVLESGFRSPMI